MADFEHYLDQIRTLTRDVFIPLEAQMEAECDVPQAAMKAIREAGKLRSEGKGYVMQDGDIVHFLFNV